MKITLDQPLCIYEIGQRSMQQDYVIPAFGEARSSDRHFMVAEGPLADIYLQKASLTFSSRGGRINVVGNCRVFLIRPGFEVPIYCSDGPTDFVTDDIQQGDWFLLMTDGMCESLSIEDLVSIINRPDWTAEHKRDALLDYTSENADNHSAYLLHIRVVEDDAADCPDDVVADDVATVPQDEPSRLRDVNIATDLQDQNVDLNGSSGVFDLSAKMLFYIIAAAYLIAVLIGFCIGLFE